MKYFRLERLKIQRAKEQEKNEAKSLKDNRLKRKVCVYILLSPMSV